MEPTEDFKLIQRVVSGEREAYAEVVRRHQGKVLQLCASMLRDPSEAEDAAQEIFLKAYRSLDRFKGTSSFSTWLYRIASNHCLDLLRRRARRKTESWEELLAQEGEKLHRMLMAGPDPARSLEASDLINRVLSQLPDEYRIVLVLREVQGLSYQEMAEALDCSLDSIKARLRRARQSLEEKLRHFLSPESV